MGTTRQRRVIFEEIECEGNVLIDSNCNKCDSPLYVDAKFCHECGEQIQKHCIKCDILMPGSAKFCMGCGIRILTLVEEYELKIEQIDEQLNEKTSEITRKDIQIRLDQRRLRDLGKKIDEFSSLGYAELKAECKELRERFQPYDNAVTEDEYNFLKAVCEDNKCNGFTNSCNSLSNAKWQTIEYISKSLDCHRTRAELIFNSLRKGTAERNNFIDYSGSEFSRYYALTDAAKKYCLQKGFI